MINIKINSNSNSKKNLLNNKKKELQNQISEIDEEINNLLSFIFSLL